MVIRISHKGLSNKCRIANSLKAFKTVLNEPLIDIIELDVHFSKKQGLIVTHDFTKGTIYPSLSKALSILKERIVKLDVKDKGIETKIMNLVKNKGMLKSIIISSPYSSFIKKIRKDYPNVRTELGCIEEKQSVSTIISKAKEAKANMIAPYYKLITRKLVLEAHKNNLEVHAWTVNNKKKMKEIEELGVDAITSDYPELIP